MTQEIIYEGKAKKIFKTDNDREVIQFFKDDVTAFNKQKHDIMIGKGSINCEISSIIMGIVGKEGINHHLIKTIDKNSQLIKKLNIIPLEVIIRNIASGSFSKRYNIPNGTKLNKTIIEFCYKDDSLGDPLMTESAVEGLGILNIDEINFIKKTTYKINEILIKLFDRFNITLVDFKIEFGKDCDGNIVLGDEITPDSCRLWKNGDSSQAFDKDLYRNNSGDLIGGYTEVLNMLRDLV